MYSHVAFNFKLTWLTIYTLVDSFAHSCDILLLQLLFAGVLNRLWSLLKTLNLFCYKFKNFLNYYLVLQFMIIEKLFLAANYIVFKCQQSYFSTRHKLKHQELYYGPDIETFSHRPPPGEFCRPSFLGFFLRVYFNTFCWSALSYLAAKLSFLQIFTGTINLMKIKSSGTWWVVVRSLQRTLSKSLLS